MTIFIILIHQITIFISLIFPMTIFVILTHPITTLIILTFQITIFIILGHPIPTFISLPFQITIFVILTHQITILIILTSQMMNLMINHYCQLPNTIPFFYLYLYYQKHYLTKRYLLIFKYLMTY